MATFKSSGSVSISELQSFFGTSAGSLSSYYRGGGIVPNVSQNNAIPTSGAISLSNFYGATNSAPQERIAVSVNIIPYRASNFWGYWTNVGTVGGGAQGVIDYVGIGSLPYTDGNGQSITINTVLWNSSTGNFDLQLSNLTNNDAKFYKAYFGGFAEYEFSRASATTGSGAGGIIYRWNIGSNPWTGSSPGGLNNSLQPPASILTITTYY